ncbi:RNP-1 like RNA-binding protein, Glycine-rich [Balamuthia mandrillaris]
MYSQGPAGGGSGGGWQGPYPPPGTGSFGGPPPASTYSHYPPGYGSSGGMGGGSYGGGGGGGTMGGGGGYGGPPPGSGYGTAGGVGGGSYGGGAPSSHGGGGYGGMGGTYPPPSGGYPSSSGGYASTAPYPSQQSQQPPHWHSQYYHMNNQNELFELQKWFRSMDRDGNGSISANELASVAVGGIRLGIELAIKLIRVFDTNNNGQIDFHEYASLHKFLLSMQAVFNAADSDRNGRLDSREIHSALQNGGFVMNYTTAAALYSKFDTSGYGLDMTQFIALVAHAAITRTTFEHKDHQKTGRVTFSFQELLEFSALL